MKEGKRSKAVRQKGRKTDVPEARRPKDINPTAGGWLNGKQLQCMQEERRQTGNA